MIFSSDYQYSLKAINAPANACSSSSRPIFLSAPCVQRAVVRWSWFSATKVTNMLQAIQRGEDGSLLTESLSSPIRIIYIYKFYQALFLTTMLEFLFLIICSLKLWSTLNIRFSEG